MKIYIGADHQGKPLAEEIYKQLTNQNYQVEMSNIPHTPDDDYPDFAFDIGNKVVNNPGSLGIILCGNGIGVSIAANKVAGIRCARVVTQEDAHHAKNHNGANMIAFGGININEAMAIIATFITTSYPTEERHIRRVNKIINYERGEYNGL